MSWRTTIRKAEADGLIRVPSWNEEHPPKMRWWTVTYDWLGDPDGYFGRPIYEASERVFTDTAAKARAHTEINPRCYRVTKVEPS